MFKFIAKEEGCSQIASSWVWKKPDLPTFSYRFETMNGARAHALVDSALKAISDEKIEELNGLGICVQQFLLLSITCAVRGDFPLKNLASIWRVYYGKQHTLEIVLC